MPIEELKVARPFNIIDLIKFFREIVRGPVMKNSMETDC